MIHRSSLFSSAIPGVLWCSIIGLAFATGCSNRTSGGYDSSVTTADSAAGGEVYTGPVYDVPSGDPAQFYILPPADAKRLGYRIDWQSDVTPLVGETLESTFVQHDAVFAVDNDKNLTRLSAANGDRIWGTQLAAPLEQIMGVAYLPRHNRVYMLTGGRMFEIEAANGALEDGFELQKLANTEPVVHGQFLIYGSRDGQLVWEAYQTGFMWRSYKIGGTVTQPPVLHEGRVVGIGDDGQVIALLADSASQLWNARALDPVTVAPAVGNGAVYVAGEDQFLRCFDLESGRGLWNRLFEEPLRHRPALIGDRLYQYVTGQGLIAFEALPMSSPGGVEVWTAPDVRGVVLVQRGRRLLVWDAETRTLSTLDAERGSVRESIVLDRVTDIITPQTGSALYAYSADGRIIKLVPTN